MTTVVSDASRNDSRVPPPPDAAEPVTNLEGHPGQASVQVGQEWLRDLPDEVSRLGKPIIVFTVPTSRLVMQGIGAVMVTVVGAFVLGILFLVFEARVPVSPWLLIAGYLLSVGVLGVVAVFSARRRIKELNGLQVMVFPDALVHLRHGRPQIWHWDQIEEINSYQTTFSVNFVPVETHRFLSFRLLNGEKVSLEESMKDLGYRAWRKLARKLAEMSLPHRLQHTMDRLQAGEVVYFGALGFGREGFVQSSDWLPLAEVQSAKFSDEEFIIRKVGGWFAWCKVKIVNIPNVDVLHLLVADLQQRGTS